MKRPDVAWTILAAALAFAVSVRAGAQPDFELEILPALTTAEGEFPSIVARDFNKAAR